jgi:hypothetical protein
MRRIVALLVTLLSVPVLRAQSSTSSVYGQVADPQGLAVPGATVTVRSTDLAAARVTRSDSSGAFRVTGLVPGAYTVEAEKRPLKLRRPVRLTVGLGSSTKVIIGLDVAEVKQKATVTARMGTSEGNTTTPPINESEPSVSTFFAGTVVTYLPNRDRDVTQFNPLSPDAHDTDDGTSDAGQRAGTTLTQVDDVRFNSPLFGAKHSEENHSFFLPQTVVREFQLVTSGVSAEIGGTSAGLVNMATKEGSNRLHGEAFYTARPATLTSSDAFGNQPGNTMNDFGLSEGGPIKKNRLFFYAGLEQNILEEPRFVEFAPQAAGASVPAVLSSSQGPIVSRQTPLALSGRLDAVLNDANTLNVELAGNRVRSTKLEDLDGDTSARTLDVTSASANESGQSLFGKAGLTTIHSARTVNRALIAWTSDHRGITPLSMQPEFFINGFGVLGGSALGAHLFTARDAHLTDDVSVSHGRALLNVGAAFEAQPSYEQREENLNGRFDYNSLTDYLNQAPRRFQQTFVTGDTRYSGTVALLEFYANEKLELRHHLALTTGLRWAGQWNPQPVHPNPAIPQTQRMPSDFTEWQPRIGLAWSATKCTVLRMSSGLYDAPTPATLYHRVFADNGMETVTADSYFDPALLTLTNARTRAPVSLPTVPNGLTTREAFVEGIDPAFRNPRSLQSALIVDQTVSSKLTLRGEYLHGATWRLDLPLDENLFAPTLNAQGLPVFPATRPIVGVGRLVVHESNAHANYDGFSVSAISQISRRTQVTLNYTLSKTRDDSSYEGPYDISSTLDPFAPEMDAAYSNLDVRHVLNIKGIFNLPLGFKLNPLVVARSGAPYAGLIGFDTQNDANDFNDRAVVNGLETPRNLYREPAFADGDVRIVKDFTLKGEGHHLDLFMDVFNVTSTSNRNFGPQQVSFFGDSSNPVFSARQALFAPGTTQMGGPREFQFTARLVGF